jgi:uncharacterized membrane protein
MDGYKWVLLLHVLTAIVWVGGACALQALAFLTIRRNDALEIARFAKDAEFVGMRIFLPSSLLLIIAGSWMIYDGPWALGDTWVAVGLALYVLSFLTGMGFLGPESGRISALTTEHGPEHPEVQRRIKRVLLVSRIELIWLIAIVVLMVIKPT